MGRMMSCFLVKESMMVGLATDPSAASLLSFLPSRLRSKPSLKSASASVDTTSWRLPENGVTSTPVHSGTALNGSTLGGAWLQPAMPRTRSQRMPFIGPSKPWRSAVRIAFRRLCVNVISVCALISAGRASAHPEFSPVTVNRYLKLDLVAGDEVRLAYSVMFGAGPALAERRLADANADGRLDEAETRALGARLAASLTGKLTVTVDGAPGRLQFEPPSVGLAGAEVGPSPFSVDLVARLACPGAGPHLLSLGDATELPQL